MNNLNQTENTENYNIVIFLKQIFKWVNPLWFILLCIILNYMIYNHMPIPVLQFRQGIPFVAIFLLGLPIFDWANNRFAPMNRRELFKYIYLSCFTFTMLLLIIALGVYVLTNKGI